MEDQETDSGGGQSTGEGKEEAPAPPPKSGEGEKESKKVPALGSASVTQPLQLRIKEEPSDDIKDFAETTMNELLGWYGYTDKVNQQDTAQLSLNNYCPSSTSPRDHSHDGDASDAENNIADGRDEREGRQEGEREGEGEGEEEREKEGRSVDSGESGESGRVSRDGEETGRLSAGSSETALAAHHRNLVTALSKSRAAKGGSEESGGPSYIVCAWCQKPGMKLFTLVTSAGSKAFCSEVCFTQCRRASFKKNKVCDWCKHVRHTVNFVDFQDGEMQLQFCSEKCLNQYKMNIFCTETQEHLKQIQSQLHEERNKNAALSPGGASSSSLSPRGVAEAASASSGKKGEEQILITPDLWLSKCKVDKLLPSKTEVIEEGEAEEPKRDRRREQDGEEETGRDRRRESTSAERIRSRELFEKKRQPPLSSIAAAAAAAFAASYHSSQASKGGASKLSPGADRPPERSPRDKERLKRLIRDSSSRDKEPHPSTHTSSSPTTSPHFSPSMRSRTSDRTTPPVVPPMLLPHLNGLGAGLAGLGMINPLLCSSLFGPGPADADHEPKPQSHRPQPAHTDRERKSASALPLPVGGGRSSERSSTTPGAAHSASPANTPSSSGTPNPPHPVQHPPPPGAFPHGVPGLVGLPGAGALPPELQPPFMFGVPPFPRPPGLFPADPALMGGLLALQGCVPGQGLPNGQPPPPGQQQGRDRHGHQQRQHPASSVPPPPPLAATAGCLSTGVPPVTVMVPFPVVLPIPVPIPIPIPIAPEKIQQFFKDREQSHTSTATAARKPSTATERVSLTSPSRDSVSSIRSDRSPTPHHLPAHNHRHLHPHPHHNHTHAHQHERQTDSVSSDSSCHSPGLSVISTRSASAHQCCADGPSSAHNGCVSCSSCRSLPRPGRESADSIMTLRKSRESSFVDSIVALRRESVRSLMAADPMSPALAVLPPGKRSLTPVYPMTLDLSKRPRLDENRNNDEEAMDLSKDSRSSSPSRSVKDLSTKPGHTSALSVSSCSSNGSAASGKENQHSDPDMASIDGDSEAGMKVPKIHIIDSRDDPPLAQPLPLPPADHPYSTRRSLILDAPSVPRPPRSPSPERRYVRTVPRDMVEAAKRRCLRARVRTK